MAGLDILNGFAGKVISDCIDIAIDKIKKADKNRKSKNQTMETRIYQVTIDALNEFPYNKYKKEEKVYDAAESILKELKRGNRDYQEAVKLGLKMLVSQVTDDICKDFLKTLCYEICKNENDVLYKEIALIQQEQLNENVNEGFKDNSRNHGETHKKLDKIQESINGLNERQGMTRDYEPENANKIPIINRADEYAQKWEKNVFLNDFRKRDKKKGKNIKLREIYLEEHLPYYVWKAYDEALDDLKDLLKEYIVDNNEKKMLLILGQAGIGKSTLITWVIANLVEKKEQVLVYQFASDLNNINWQSNNILNDIFKVIGYGYRELEGKTLILDGFDEIYISSDRERILNKLNQELEGMNFLKRFSLIITCRENYINQSDLRNIEYITLQAWNEEQIKSFCEVYEKKNVGKSPEAINNKNLEAKINKILENKEIFGIPLILYMVLALNINIEKDSSKIDIYDQIFSLGKGGIYDRCYDKEHRINSPGIKEHIHQISQRIAFWMFENNADKASIPQEKFKEICNNEINKLEEKGYDIERDVLIGNYFASIKHCEGVWTDELQFVHRSIYEYFVVVYFFNSVYKLKSKEEVAGKLGKFLKDGQLSEQILEFIKYKFSSVKQYNLPKIIKEIFQIMLRDGMTYHTGIPLINVIDREIKVFSNMLEVVCLWNSSLGKVDNKIITYLQHNNQKMLNLKGIELGAVNLHNIYLEKANLEGAKLSTVNFSRGNLKGANLKGTALESAILEGANLVGANLEGANLEGANLIGANLVGNNSTPQYYMRVSLDGLYLYSEDLKIGYLEEANLKGTNLENAELGKALFSDHQVELIHKSCDLTDSYVYIFETKEIVSYKEYCAKKQKKERYRHFKLF